MKLLFLAFAFLFASCAHSPKVEEPQHPAKDHFAGLKGCHLLFNMKTEKFDHVIGDETCRERFSASSTFKVPLAVMAFDAGVLKDENTILKWDGKKDEREVANRDHSAKTWMSESIVWYSQRITPKLGQAKVQKYLNDFDYGNKDLSGGLTQAWLISPSAKSGQLAISAYEQVEFLKKLWRDQLPASPHAMKLARDLTFVETSPKGFQLHGKTGSNFYDKDRKMRLGWFIAHLAKDGQEYVVVTNFSDFVPTDEKVYGGMKAREITKLLLADQGLW